MNLAEKAILRRVGTGHIKLRNVTEIHVYHFSHRRWLKKKTRTNKGRYTLSFKIDKRAITVYRNRAIWIIHNKVEIPEGMVVDHIDGDKTNDNPTNLQLHSATESHLQGHYKLVDKNFKEVCEFFELEAWLRS